MYLPDCTTFFSIRYPYNLRKYCTFHRAEVKKESARVSKLRLIKQGNPSDKNQLVNHRYQR